MSLLDGHTCSTNTKQATIRSSNTFQWMMRSMPLNTYGLPIHNATTSNRYIMYWTESCICYGYLFPNSYITFSASLWPSRELHKHQTVQVHQVQQSPSYFKAIKCNRAPAIYDCKRNFYATKTFTVRCRYNAVSLLQNSHNRNLIARP